VGRKAEKAALAVQQMARVIRTRMLLSSGISVAAQEYFDIATVAVDSVFAWIGESGDQLMQAGSREGMMFTHRLDFSVPKFGFRPARRSDVRYRILVAAVGSPRRWSVAEPAMSTLFASLDGMLFRCLVDDYWTLLSVSPGCRELTGYVPRRIWSAIRKNRWKPDPSGRSGRRAGHHPGGARYRGALPHGVPHRLPGWRGKMGAGARHRSARRGGRQIIEGYLEDITDRVLAQIQLAETELRYRSIFENSVVGMFQSTESGRYLAANQALATLYRYPTPEALISSLADIATGLYVDQRRRADFKRLIQRDGRVSDFESEVICRDGSRIWISENAHAVCAPDGSLLYYEGTVEDITERHRYQSVLQHQATHDPLTGLPNRNLLQDRLEQAVQLARRQASKVGIGLRRS
jgi:PAS domain S-box-containing protein